MTIKWSKQWWVDLMLTCIVYERDIKSITEVLMKEKVIFHPRISPTGIPNFQNYGFRDFVLLIDRNICSSLLQLCKKGELPNPHVTRLIGCLMFWSIFNNISVTSGVALTEYLNTTNNRQAAGNELKIFQEIFNYYHPNVWLNLGLGREKAIEPIILEINDAHELDWDLDHFYFHYAEMLHISYLLNRNDMEPEEKMIEYLQWTSSNLLFSQYTTIYACMLFTNSIKASRFTKKKDILKECRNQAWDLTYLSEWSTLYWDDMLHQQVFLFSTFDKALKRIFIETHSADENFLYKWFGRKNGEKILHEYIRLTNRKTKTGIKMDDVKSIIKQEEDKLIELLNGQSN